MFTNVCYRNLSVSSLLSYLPRRLQLYSGYKNTFACRHLCFPAILLDPKYTKALLRRAQLHEETDKLDEALDDFKRVLEIESNNQKAIEACVRLPPMIEARNEKLKAEMLGKCVRVRISTGAFYH